MRWGKADPGQRVTARDMALLAAHIIRDYPDYYHYFGEKEFTWNKIRQLNRNPLLTMDMGADGLKAGDLADSGFGLVGSAVQNGQRLIVVVNGLKTATERAEEARKLFDWGFHSFDRAHRVRGRRRSGPAAVYGGEPRARSRWSRERPVTMFVAARTKAARSSPKSSTTGRSPAPVAEGAGRRAAQDLARRHAGRRRAAEDAAAVALGGLTSRAFDAGVELAAALHPRCAGVCAEMTRRAARAVSSRSRAARGPASRCRRGVLRGALEGRGPRGRAHARAGRLAARRGAARGDPRPASPRRSGPKARRCCSRPPASTISTTRSVPALERGAWVVCDRFADSTRAYQGAGGQARPAGFIAAPGTASRSERTGPT